MNPRVKPRGAGDPNRPDRLIDAALSIMLKQGIQGLSHRAVAAEAKVPLGSTTYYFADLDALLAAAIERLIQRTRVQFAVWSKTVMSVEQLPEKLGELIFSRLTDERDQAVLAYELYGLAMRKPKLRSLNDKWMGILLSHIENYLDEAAAIPLVAMIDGLMIQGLVSNEPPCRGRIIGALSIALNSKLPTLVPSYSHSV